MARPGPLPTETQRARVRVRAVAPFSPLSSLESRRLRSQCGAPCRILPPPLSALGSCHAVPFPQRKKNVKVTWSVPKGSPPLNLIGGPVPPHRASETWILTPGPPQPLVPSPNLPSPVSPLRQIAPAEEAHFTLLIASLAIQSSHHHPPPIVVCCRARRSFRQLLPIFFSFLLV